MHDTLFDRKDKSKPSPAEKLSDWLIAQEVDEKEAKTALVDLEKVQIM